MQIHDFEQKLLVFIITSSEEVLFIPQTMRADFGLISIRHGLSRRQSAARIKRRVSTC